MKRVYKQTSLSIDTFDHIMNVKRKLKEVYSTISTNQTIEHIIREHRELIEETEGRYEQEAARKSKS